MITDDDQLLVAIVEDEEGQFTIRVSDDADYHCMHRRDELLAVIDALRESVRMVYGVSSRRKTRRHKMEQRCRA